MSDSPTEWNRNDRDLLVELRTEMKGVRNDIKNISDGNNSRLLLLEQGKLDRTEANRLQSEGLSVHVDHEARIRRLEAWRWLTLGGSSVIASIFASLVTYITTVLH